MPNKALARKTYFSGWMAGRMAYRGNNATQPSWSWKLWLSLTIFYKRQHTQIDNMPHRRKNSMPSKMMKWFLSESYLSGICLLWQGLVYNLAVRCLWEFSKREISGHYICCYLLDLFVGKYSEHCDPRQKQNRRLNDSDLSFHHPIVC